MVDCNADDILGTVSRIQDVHDWYSRLARAIGRRAVTGGGTPLSATLLERYLRPGSTPLPFRWQAPVYLIDQACMRDTLDHHRNVYLTHEQTRPAGRWGGVEPRYRRIQAQIGGGAFPFVMHYESLVDPPARWSVIGDDD